jgi:DNA-binding beta-propeller fold protein YncE
MRAEVRRRAGTLGYRRGRFPGRALGAGLVALLAAALVLPSTAAADPAPLGLVGSSGTGAGQLRSPQGVALDAAGNLYVAESNNDRISVFAPDGSFTHAFGWGVETGAAAFEVCTTASGCQAGSDGGGAGQLDFPIGLALDGAGGLYVAEDGNDRISFFDVSAATPTFTHAFGWNVDPVGGTEFEVCTDGSGCQTGTQGGGAGQLRFPDGVAHDGADGLYVGDSGNHRISLFNVSAAPTFTRAFGWGVDTGAAAFQVCTSPCQAGSQGGGAGQLRFPGPVAHDGADALYVPDGNHRVNVFDTAVPSFTRAFGWGVDTGAAAFEVCTSPCQAGSAGGGAGQLNFAFGVALDGAGGLYVGGGNNDRISLFNVSAAPTFTRAFGWGVDTGAAAFELCTAASGCLPGLGGGGAGQLEGPAQIATGGAGNAVVADTGNHRVQCFGEGPPPDLCGPYPDPPPPPPPVSNNFSFGKPKLNRRRGIAILPVRVPAGGRVILLRTPKVRRAVRNPAGARVVRLPVRARGKFRKRLLRTGRVRVRARVRFRPTGGTARTKSRVVRLVKRKRR